VTDRYVFDNSLADESDRLKLLERIADPRSAALFETIGVQRAWRCVELGAGGGSMAAWLADRVGARGSVQAVDMDVTALEHLKARPNVQVVASTLEGLALPPESFDLVHTRNVLMHLAEPETVIGKAIDALAPGGSFLFEEADYWALSGATSQLFARVASPLVGRWTWARGLPSIVSRFPVEELCVTIDAPMLNGGSAEAAFWIATFTSARDRLGVADAEFDQLMALLADPNFFTPFASVVCVSGRKT
jgi:SAM-dependent methyltransferase